MQLYPILQAHFPWHKARVTFLSAFLLALMKVTTVNLTKLANALNGKVKQKSNYRRIQRFFAEFTLPEDWATGLILHLLPVKSDFILAMDRTQWSLGKVSINLLTVGILYRDMAFPICFKMLHKKGNSSTQERIDLMKRVRQHIKPCKIRALVADREFIGRKWFKWLTENNMPFVIRLKENALLETGQNTIPLKKRFANLTLNQQTTLPKPGRVYGQSLSLSAIRCPEEWVMVGSNTPDIDALLTYKKRWRIEVLFANLKRRGFDLEQTHLTDADRIEKLIALLTLAVCWAHLMGEERAHHTPLKIKNHDKKEKSLFRYGLDYLQYVLLNIQDHARTFQRCLKILKEARFLPDS